MQSSWTAIFTSSKIGGFSFEVPSSVLQTAASPLSVNGSIDITWKASDQFTKFFVVLHISEIQVLSNNSLREFCIFADGVQNFKDPVRLNYLWTFYAWYTDTGRTDYNMSLKSTARSTLPPILNAFEVYTIVPLTRFPTDTGDVTAINSIKMSYNIGKDWSGDPCIPTNLGWTGIRCSIESSNISRITAVNLTSSGLNGTIISAFASLTALETLDMSKNNLLGSIPAFLDQLVLLTYLDISGNSGLSKKLPAGLQKRLDDGYLTVIFNSTSNNTADGIVHKKSSKIFIIVAAVVSFLVIVVAALLLLYLNKNKRTPINPSSDREGPRDIDMESSSNVVGNPKESALAGGKELNIDKRKFSFMELKQITSNFRDQIGTGGFGKVFKGYLEDGIEVAVKVRSELSSHGAQQFLNEVEKLSRVHHKNLVSLIGYCLDGDHIALVYQHMQKGNLQYWIRGGAHSLQWKERLRIAYESAQGFEYLHKMCNPPLIHRDIKSNNILLTTNLEAKVSDFGSVRDCSGTHVTTQVIGTDGYLDPYYASTSHLTEKSDVYSFGVVLLEIITGKSPILEGPQGSQYNLTQFVQEWLSKGKIESILDPNMGGKYNMNSIWKVANLALRCTGHPRPDMTEVVTELKEAFNLEMSTFEASSMASEDISQYSGYSRNDFPRGAEVHGDNFEMARMGSMQLPDYGPLAR
ncbi:Leucine-rich repeat protein kinase family protein [Rhynchospora pubera]|uniref:non-specific serine/threonine protein kinase n=1 Tax=Rhynchospora pubera TaxID=906938 RepID=A0AAV8GWN8_9POAL|nr:Leucine-rich repeat protein kinase family protein [Rhynchospora pubera]